MEGGKGICCHPAPEESGEAFPPGAILIVPLRIASGVRMKILEAWARGVPVLATPEAAAGLEAQDGRELLLFRDAEELVSCLRRLRDEPALSSRMIEDGRTRLERHHSSQKVATGLIRVYEAVLARLCAHPCEVVVLATGPPEVGAAIEAAGFEPHVVERLGWLTRGTFVRPPPPRHR